MISKLGFAACSILTLGCVCRLEFSNAVGGGWTGGGWRARDPVRSASSPKSTESIMLLLIELLPCFALRNGNDCSFDGGAGGGSDWLGALSPSGPSGSNESSTASSLVVCASTRRGVRGVRDPLPDGERGPEDVDGVLRFWDLVLDESAT